MGMIRTNSEQGNPVLNEAQVFQASSVFCVVVLEGTTNPVLKITTSKMNASFNEVL